MLATKVDLRTQKLQLLLTIRPNLQLRHQLHLVNLHLRHQFHQLLRLQEILHQELLHVMFATITITLKITLKLLHQQELSHHQDQAKLQAKLLLLHLLPLLLLLKDLQAVDVSVILVVVQMQETLQQPLKLPHHQDPVPAQLQKLHLANLQQKLLNQHLLRHQQVQEQVQLDHQDVISAIKTQILEDKHQLKQSHPLLKQQLQLLHLLKL
jgi:hypothetical protein